MACMSSGCWRQLLGPVGMDIFLVGAVKVGWRGLVAEVCVWGLGWNWETGQALLIVVVGALIGALHYNFVCGTCSWLVLKLFPGFEGFSTPNPGTRSSMYHQATGCSSQELLKWAQLPLVQKSSDEAMKCSVSNFLVSPTLQLQCSICINHHFSCLSFRRRNLHLPSDERSLWERKHKAPLYCSANQEKKIPLIFSPHRSSPVDKCNWNGLIFFKIVGEGGMVWQIS